ncbi:hypothetical protein CVIRNUC_011064 [Coccomyxa viridis]|uniref:Uncharacterized protein n=1 Tax=Coccomyxa viridis TaxID=1274662 RepID=A0AAV1INK7_9CHLO|nr:hypothetical protein CVIRNUC_011064 [Coccomyxa viridis]
MKETLAESMMTGRHLLDNVPAGLGANDRGSATISNTGNGSGVGGSGASGSGGTDNNSRTQATSGAALAPGSIAPASG